MKPDKVAIKHLDEFHIGALCEDLMLTHSLANLREKKVHVSEHTFSRLSVIEGSIEYNAMHWIKQHEEN